MSYLELILPEQSNTTTISSYTEEEILDATQYLANNSDLADLVQEMAIQQQRQL